MGSRTACLALSGRGCCCVKVCRSRCTRKRTGRRRLHGSEGVGRAAAGDSSARAAALPAPRGRPGAEARGVARALRRRGALGR